MAPWTRGRRVFLAILASWATSFWATSCWNWDWYFWSNHYELRYRAAHACATWNWCSLSASLRRANSTIGWITQIIDDGDDVNRYNTAFLHYDDDADFAEEEEHDREVWKEVPEELLDEVNGCFSGLRYHFLGWNHHVSFFYHWRRW